MKIREIKFLKSNREHERKLLNLKFEKPLENVKKRYTDVNRKFLLDNYFILILGSLFYDHKKKSKVQTSFRNKITIQT